MVAAGELVAAPAQPETLQEKPVGVVQPEQGPGIGRPTPEGVANELLRQFPCLSKSA